MNSSHLNPKPPITVILNSNCFTRSPYHTPIQQHPEIFRVHLQKLRPSRLREFDLELLARHSLDYSGAEIEQAIVEGMQQAFSSGTTGNRSDFNTEHIIRALEETVPLATIAKPQIEALKQWASNAGARPASIYNYQKSYAKSRTTEASTI
ncbi:hypothetical protein [Chamaesiphon sp. VAR_48_metabat_135_sub]|uniref:hypothetical protein n=1 Tax=Chamaesiphon sp. VAR_48_metabat_135_sub TaxID=2964699 RepID=UPI00286B285C|nr:hypothetical protein [Chamaesiphon sp. VAR_48_metabat_135_sub]